MRPFLSRSLAEQLAQGHRRIVHRAAENAGVQIARRAVQRDFKRDDAAQRIGERRMIGVGHAGVGNDDGVAVQFAAVRLEKFREVRAADFLLAFDDERQIAGQGSAGFQIGFDGLEMREVLAFVVGACRGRKSSGPRCAARTAAISTSPAAPAAARRNGHRP